MINNPLRQSAISLVSGLILASQCSLAYAETREYEVRPNDTLGVIVSAQYPGYSNRDAIMQFLLEKNPQAFIGNDLNRLIVGRTLQLPDAADIPAVEPPQPPPPEPVAELVAPATPEQPASASAELARAEKERDALRTQLEQLTQEQQQRQQEQKDQQQQQEQQITALTNALETSKQQAADAAKQLEASQQQAADAAKQLAEQAATLAATPVTPATSEPATPATDPAVDDGLDPQILLQQLEALESANDEIRAENEKLSKALEASQQQAADAAKQLEASQQQAADAAKQLAEQAATLAATPVTPATSEPATPATDPAVDDGLDPQILLQQLEALESANDEIRAENEKLSKELEASKKAAVPAEGMDPDVLLEQLQALESANDQIRIENEDLQKTLATSKLDAETAQKDLQIAKAAQANAELTQANLENSSTPLWPWLLALLLLPIAWWLGRKSQPAVAKRAIVAAPAPQATVTPPPAPRPAAQPTPAEPASDVGSETSARTPRNERMASYLSQAANDDDPDAAIKLDMARAYLDLRDSESAYTVLNEVLREGGKQQQQEAREILSFIS